jgi:hypothetical protein
MVAMLYELPAELAAAVAKAQLPLNYEQAKNALAECEQLDQCSEWADKAAALASYARQADNEELENLAKRIRLRASRRCGELLLQLDARGGDGGAKPRGLSLLLRRRAQRPPRRRVCPSTRRVLPWTSPPSRTRSSRKWSRASARLVLRCCEK